MVNPFNGEGIAYAMESGEIAADAIAEAHYRGAGPPSAERALRGVPGAVEGELGGYYTLGPRLREADRQPAGDAACTKYGLPRRTLMRFTLKLMANLTDSRDGDAMDKLINSLCQDRPGGMSGCP